MNHMWIYKCDATQEAKTKTWNRIAGILHRLNRDKSRGQIDDQYHDALIDYLEHYDSNVDWIAKTIILLCNDIDNLEKMVELNQKNGRDIQSRYKQLVNHSKKQDEIIRALKLRLVALDKPSCLLPVVEPTAFPWNVYFLQSHLNGLIKIGKTSKQNGQRIRNIETLSPVPVNFVGGLLASDNHQTEQELHRQFADYCHHGEWFIPDPKLLAYIQSLAKSK